MFPRGLLPRCFAPGLVQKNFIKRGDLKRMEEQKGKDGKIQ
jgi:hypothetical protein